MLAKDCKIGNLKKQREFIQRQLEYAKEKSSDGDTVYMYTGHLYPEVIKYFEEEGFTITKLQSDILNLVTKGLPIYLFTVSDEIVLSDEELKEAEAREGFKGEANTFDSDEEDPMAFIRSLRRSGGFPGLRMMFE